MSSAFYILAAVILASGIAAMSLRNLVHCALCLAISFVGMAGIFLELNAPFLAFAQILVYVGAVAILIVFAILLTRSSESQAEQPWRHLAFSVGVAVLLGAALVGAMASSKLLDGTRNAQAPGVAEVGRALMTTYVTPLQIVGVLLTAALLGAVVLALQEAPEKGGQA